MVLSHAHGRRTVVSLKADDPMIFGRGEEFRYLRDHPSTWTSYPALRPEQPLVHYWSTPDQPRNCLRSHLPDGTRSTEQERRQPGLGLHGHLSKGPGYIHESCQDAKHHPATRRTRSARRYPRLRGRAGLPRRPKKSSGSNWTRFTKRPVRKTWTPGRDAGGGTVGQFRERTRSGQTTIEAPG
jgi:hypothetical protein